LTKPLSGAILLREKSMFLICLQSYPETRK
jgi:hypothetical protein